MTIRRLSPMLPWLFLLPVLLALLPWGQSLLRTPPHSDLVWLYEAFARWAGGQTMAESIFEPNPPLSLLTYALPYVISTLTGVSAQITIFVYVMLLVAISSWAVGYIVMRLTRGDQAACVVVVGGFILSQTLMTNALYGERDHLLALGLVPFVLFQYALNRNMVIPAHWRWPVFMIGAFLILLKPHHGLIPFLMVLDGLRRERKLSVLWRADTLSLAIMLIVYVLLLLFVFSDYAVTIFPDVWQLYLSQREIGLVKLVGLFFLAGTVLFFLTCYLRYRICYFDLILLLTASALLSLIPYYVQGKGFYYHLFPAMGFFVPAVALLVAEWLSFESKRRTFSAGLALAALMGLVLVIFPANRSLPDYHEYHDKALTRMITAACSDVPNCSFFMFNDSMGIVHETAYVTGITHGSRFPSFWFLPEMLQQDLISPEESEILRLSYGGRIAEDLERYQPQILIIGRFSLVADGFFDFAAYWAVSDSFRAAWEKYHHDGTLDIAYGDYYPGTMVMDLPAITYDIYRLAVPDQ